MKNKLALAALLALAACLHPEPVEPQDNLAEKNYRIMGPKGDIRADLALEVADTDAARLSGLMGRAELLPETGMLFVFDAPDYWSMWMKNTMIPLDMLFVNDAGRITAIAPNRKPFSTDYITPCTVEYEKRRAIAKDQPIDIDSFYDECEARFARRNPDATRSVIELPAGDAKRYGVRIGDQLIPLPPKGE